MPDDRTRIPFGLQHKDVNEKTDSQGVLRMIVIESKRPCSPLFGLRTLSKRCVKMSGTSRLPMPNDSAAASTNRSLRVKRMYDSTRSPETATLANRNVVTPPKTGFGTEKEDQDDV